MKAWCDNLQTYGDYENRLPRGRTYVRNGSVIDLQIEPGKVRAQVFGSSLYQVEIGITVVSSVRWKSLAKECTGSIASLVELLQGNLSKAVMASICQPSTGLFPAPRDIKLNCTCPDWAIMCKHVAAALYGIGARLDAQPELLFTLRQVDANELVTQAATASLTTGKKPARGKVLDHSQLANVFGIEMDIPADLPDTKKQAKKKVEKKKVVKKAVMKKAVVKKAIVKKAIVEKIGARLAKPAELRAVAAKTLTGTLTKSSTRIQVKSLAGSPSKTPAQKKRQRTQT